MTGIELQAAPALTEERRQVVVVNFLAFLLYFGLLAALALPHGLDTRLVLGGEVTPLADSAALSKAFGMGDAGAYVLGGREIAETGWIHSYGLVPLWPPGMFVFTALAHRLAGSGGPVALAIILMTLAAWAAVLTLLFVHMRRTLKPAIAAVLPLSLLAFPFMRDYMIAGGMFGSESLSAALWAIGVLFLFFGAGSAYPVIWGTAAGIILAAGAYVRNQVEIIVDVTTVLVLIGGAIWLLAHARRGRYAAAKDGDGLVARCVRQLNGAGVGRQLLTLAVAFAAFHALTMPYRAYNYEMHGKFAWALGYGYYYRYVWTPPEDYKPIAQFIRAGGGPIGCAVDVETCDRLREQRRTAGEQSIPLPLYETLTTQAILKHPIAWLRYRLSYLPQYWFSRPALSAATSPDYLPGILLIALALCVCLLLLVIPIGEGSIVLGANWIGLVAGTAAVFLFIHYEVRYLVHLQSAIVVLALAGFAQWAGHVNEAAAVGGGAQRSRIAHWLRPFLGERRVVNLAQTDAFALVPKRVVATAAIWGPPLLFAFWLGVTLAIVFPHGAQTTFSYCCGWKLPLNGTLADIHRHFGDSDAGAYITLGTTLAQTGHIIGPGQAPLWSPGMPILYALVYRTVGPDGPAVLAVALIGAIAWAWFCYLFAATAYRYSGSRLAWAAPVLIFAVPSTTSYLMNAGLFFSETLSTALWGCGGILLLNAARDRSLARAALAGAVLFGAGFVRNSFEIVGDFASALAVAMLLGALLVRAVDAWRRRSGAAPLWSWLGTLARSRELHAILVAILVFQAGGIAYRTNNLIYYGEFRWSFTNYYFIYPWLRDEEVAPAFAFTVSGGVNIACKVDPDACAQFRALREARGPDAVPWTVYQRRWMTTLLRHPITWHSIKLPLIADYWTSRFSWAAPVPGPWAFWLGIADALVLLLACIGLVVALLRKQAVALFVFGAGTIAGSYALLMLMHLEVRYLIPLQVFSPVLAVLALTRLFAVRPEPGADRASPL